MAKSEFRRGQVKVIPQTWHAQDGEHSHMAISFIRRVNMKTGDNAAVLQRYNESPLWGRRETGKKVIEVWVVKNLEFDNYHEVWADRCVAVLQDGTFHVSRCYMEFEL